VHRSGRVRLRDQLLGHLVGGHLSAQSERPQRRSLARQSDHKRQSTYQDEAEGPSRIQIEPTPRHELETLVAVDQPCQEAAGGDHRDGMDDGNQDGHTETSIDKGACRLVASVDVGGSAETKIDRHEHQSSTMRDRI
jgi:hypothetical protein